MDNLERKIAMKQQKRIKKFEKEENKRLEDAKSKFISINSV